MTWVLPFWHFYLAHWEAFTGYAVWLVIKRTPPARKYRQLQADKRRARRLRRPGKADENGWRPRTNYERR